MSSEAVPAEDLQMKTKEEAHMYDSLHGTGHHYWSAVYIKEELLSSPDENQNSDSIDPLKVVKEEVGVVNELARGVGDLNMPPTPTPISGIIAADGGDNGQLSGSNSELREVMAAARAALSQPDGDATFIPLCSSDLRYSNNAAYSLQYNGSLYMDDKTANGGYSATNHHYPNVTHNGQPSTSSITYLNSPAGLSSISPTNDDNMSPPTHPPPSPAPYFSINANGSHTSLSPANYTGASPTGHAPNSPTPYAGGNPTRHHLASSSRAGNFTSVSPEPYPSISLSAQASKDPNSPIPQASGSTSLLPPTFNPVTEVIIPDIYLYDTLQQQGPPAYHSVVPVPHGQSFDFFNQGPATSGNAGGKASPYFKALPANSSPSVRQVSAAGPSGGSPSPASDTSKRRSASASSPSANPRAGPIRSNRKRCSSQSRSAAPYSIEGSILTPYQQPHLKPILPSTSGPTNDPLLSFNQAHLPSLYSNNETFPALSQPQRSTLYSPPIYTLPKVEENSSFQPFILPPSNKTALTGDSSPQTYTHLVPQSRLANSAAPLSNQPDVHTYTTNAPSITFSGTSQLSVYSQVSPHPSSSSSSTTTFSPALPPFTTINPATAVASTSSLPQAQGGGKQVIELVNGDAMPNVLYRNESSNSINLAAGPNDPSATKRTPSRVFSCALQATCSLCGVRFASSGHLKRHLQSHGSNRRFKCHVCDCAYSRQDNLKKHLLAAHGLSQAKNG